MKYTVESALNKIMSVIDEQIAEQMETKNKIPSWDQDGRSIHQNRAEGMALIKGYVFGMLEEIKKEEK